MAIPAPFKVCIPSRGKSRIGIAAYSYEHLREVLRDKYRVSGEFCLQQEDGTLVCDQDYFKLLAPNTKLTVAENLARHSDGPTTSAGTSLGNKRSAQIEPDSATGLLAKQPCLEEPLPAPCISHSRRLPSQSHFTPHGVHSFSRPVGSTTPPTLPQLVPLHQLQAATPLPTPVLGRMSPHEVLSRSPPTFDHISPPRSSAMEVESRRTSRGLNSRANNNTSSLVSQLQISSVMGNVSMSPSPLLSSPTRQTPLRQASPLTVIQQLQHVLPPLPLPHPLQPPSHPPIQYPTPQATRSRPPASVNPGHRASHVMRSPQQLHPVPTAPHQLAGPGRCVPSPAVSPPSQMYCQTVISPPPLPRHPYLARAIHMHPYANTSPYPPHHHPMYDSQTVYCHFNPHYRKPQQPTSLSAAAPPMQPPPVVDRQLRFDQQIREEYLQDLLQLERNSRNSALLHQQQQHQHQQHQHQHQQQQHEQKKTNTQSGRQPVPHLLALPTGIANLPVGNRSAGHEQALPDPVSSCSSVVSLVHKQSRSQELSTVSSSLSLRESPVESTKTGSVSSCSSSPESVSTYDTLSEAENETLTSQESLRIEPDIPETPTAQTNLVSLSMSESPSTEFTPAVTERVTTVNVVSCPESDPLADSDCDEDDDKLCIIEQACSPHPLTQNTPEQVAAPSSPLPSTRKKSKPANLPILTCKSPSVQQSLGDPKYPIIIESEESDYGAGDQCSPDDGYSSGSSPYDATRDFTSQLPFADYDDVDRTVGQEFPVMQTAVNEDKKTDQDTTNAGMMKQEEMSLKEGKADEECVSSPETVSVDMSSWEGQEDEEDFDMNVDVFLTGSAQQPLPLPLGTPPPQEEPTTGVEGFKAGSAEEDLEDSIPAECDTDSLQLLVSISRERLPDYHPPVSEASVSVASGDLGHRESESTTSYSPKVRQRRRKQRHCSDTLDSLYCQPTACNYSPYRRRIQQRRHSSISDRPHPPRAIPAKPEKMIVRIPAYRNHDGRIVCCRYEEDDTEDDSDAPTATMELLAASLELSAKDAKRLPQIIRLEPHLSEDEHLLEDIARVSSPAAEPPAVVVEEYGCEVSVRTVCSIADMASCLQGLSDLCRQVTGADSSGEEGSVVVCLDVGDEVELGGLSQDSNSGYELTGMELLNLNDEQQPPPLLMPGSSKCSSVQLQNVCSVDSETDSQLEPAHAWAVQTLQNNSYVSDPRSRVQRYSLSSNALFQLSCSHGKWVLKTL